jgi:hypothetical protein
MLLGEEPADRFWRRVVGDEARRSRRAAVHALDGDGPKLVFEGTPFDVVSDARRLLANVAGAQGH